MALSPAATLEAVLFASGEPLTKKRLSAFLGVSPELLEQGLAALAADLEGRGLALIDSGDEVELRTAPGAAEIIKKLRESELSKDLGKAGLEALAIIAYQGGAARGDIDWVRGVNSAAAVRSLLMRGLIERVEDPSDKRRARYAITTEALAHLGVGKKEELPQYEEFTAALKKQAEAQEAALTEETNHGA